MRARSIPFASMFSWVPATFRLVGRNAGALVAAGMLTFLLALAWMAPMAIVMFQTMPPLGSPGVPQPQDMTAFWIAYAITIVLGMLLFPPLLAGWFRLCANADRGVAVSGLDVLAAYRDREAWGRLVRFALIGMLSYAAVFGLAYLAFHGVFAELFAMQAAQQVALATGTAPPVPSPAVIGQIFLMYALMMPVMFVLQFVYMVGFAEVSLRPTPAVSAFVEAGGGVLRNLLKLLLFLMAIGMVAMFAMLLVAMVIGILVAVFSLLNQVLAFVVVGLAYLCLLLLIYPLMFAFHYYLWKDMLGGDEAPAGGAVAA
jgi:hypothetical protein